ncbi:hypothetical protein [Arthrobacter sp. E3]|uniref:hypothetical protein n=1 Tax=Arthrobacter sp. E3 TaxID=517402 RepID=UPI001FFC58DA|nr:hypothetical protein [Arthrobacter sp. E3]
MVHNGIEYGMMGAIAEGMNILHKANIGAPNPSMATLKQLRWRIRNITAMTWTFPKSPKSGAVAA